MPGDMVEVVHSNQSIKVHRQIMFGSMSDAQVELALSVLRDGNKYNLRIVSCFFENMLDPDPFDSCLNHSVQTLIDTHHMTLQIALLFEGTKLFYWWLFVAERLACVAKDVKFKGTTITWPEDVMSRNNHPGIDAAYLQIIKAICSKMNKQKQSLLCPWSHLSLLSEPPKYSVFNKPVYAYYCQMVSTTEISAESVADSLLIPRPNFCIAIDSDSTGYGKSFMVHDWVMASVWPYCIRALDYGDRKITLPSKIFSESTLRQLIAAAYGYEVANRDAFRFWLTVRQDVLDEFELNDIATWYGRQSN
jgi:hypothetical protein